MSTNAVTKFIRNDTIQQRIEQLLDKRASQFTTSLITAVNSNEKLAKCKPETVLNAALTAASMDLPINQNLGFAYLIPYGNDCQFQMGWKGFVQLAQRSGQYKTISAAPVYEGQLAGNDPLKGITFDWSVEAKGDPIGYAAFFELLNGFEKTLYMDMQTITGHGKRYSKSYNSGPWKDNFESMALKTVLKLLISKFGPMSTEMETAVSADQAVVKDEGQYDYVDVTVVDDPEASMIEEAIAGANSPDELKVILANLKPDQKKQAQPLIAARLEELDAKTSSK